MIKAVLQDNGLKEFIDQDILKPPTSDVKYLAEWRKSVAKARQIILEGVQDHIVSSLHGKETSYSMWKTLNGLFQNRSDHIKLALKEKIGNIKMGKGDSIPKYFTKFTHCRDELGSVGIIVSEEDIVSLDLLGLPRVGTIIRTSSMGGRSY